MTRFLVAIMALAAATAGATTPTTKDVSPTLTIDKGTVLVSHGSQYVTAKPGQVLKPGDRVIVLQGGKANVSFGNGRTSALPAGSLSDIGSMNSVTSVNSRKVGTMYAQAVGDREEHRCHDSDGREVKCPVGAESEVADANVSNAAGYSMLILGTAAAIIFNRHHHSFEPPISAP